MLILVIGLLWNQNLSMMPNLETFINETMLSDLSICDGLIEYHKNNVEYKRRGLTAAGEVTNKNKVSTDAIVHGGSQNHIIQKYKSEVISATQIYCKKYSLDRLFQIGIKEPFNIQHYAPNEGFFNWHCERSYYQSHQRALVFMTYLNDVEDGGETEFYYQQLKIKPVKGKMVIWPPDFTHLHRGITSPTQEKYIATGWMNFFDVMDTGRMFIDAIQKMNK